MLSTSSAAELSGFRSKGFKSILEKTSEHRVSPMHWNAANSELESWNTKFKNSTLEFQAVRHQRAPALDSHFFIFPGPWMDKGGPFILSSSPGLGIMGNIRYTVDGRNPPVV